MELGELLFKGQLGMLAEKNSSLFFLWLSGFLFSAAAAYFAGSINTAVIISKYRFNQDIREIGSRNAGATNMLRSFGKTAAAATFAGDALKTIFSVYLGLYLNGYIGGYLAALFCVIGHAFPVYYKFKGGKGVAVTAISILILQPEVFLITFTVFLIIVFMTKYVSLASVISVLFYPLVLYKNLVVPIINSYTPPFCVIVALVNALIVVYLHRENIRRLRDGNENKLKFNKKKKIK